MRIKVTPRTRTCVHCAAMLRPWHWRFCSEACYQARYEDDFAERFWALVEKTDGCWLWRGRGSGNGYGAIDYQGIPDYAHRVAYRLTKGEIPTGLNICHVCDVRACVCPDHLIAETQRFNVQDAVRKGRFKPPTNKRQPTYDERARGERVAVSKLTTASVLEIRRLYATGTVSQTDLAKQFGVHQASISNILKGRTWLHV
jgi:DNA-binding XRE family transcriptional regulator